MSLVDVLNAKSQQLSVAIGDAAGFVLAPRRYLRSIETEPVAATVRRLAILALAFAALEAVLFAQGAGSISIWLVVFLGVLETAISIFVIPIFYTVVRMMGGRSALRVAVAYVLTLRFTVLVPAVVAYALFVITEDYTFALLRGLATAGYVMALLTVLPLTYFDRLRQRFLALVVALSAFVGYMALADALIARFHTSSAISEQLSLLYDPIGAEVDRYVAPDHVIRDSVLDPSAFRLAPLVLRSGKEDESHRFIILQADTMAALARRWIQERDAFRTNHAAASALTVAGLDSARFQTTRRMLVAKADWLMQLDKYAKLLDDYSVAPRAGKLSPLLSEDSEASRRLNTLLRLYLEHVSVRYRLVRAGLLDLPSTSQ